MSMNNRKLWIEIRYYNGIETSSSWHRDYKSHSLTCTVHTHPFEHGNFICIHAHNNTIVCMQTTETGVENLYFAQPWPNDESTLNRTKFSWLFANFDETDTMFFFIVEKIQTHIPNRSRFWKFVAIKIFHWMDCVWLLQYSKSMHSRFAVDFPYIHKTNGSIARVVFICVECCVQRTDVWWIAVRVSMSMCMYVCAWSFDASLCVGCCFCICGYFRSWCALACGPTIAWFNMNTPFAVLASFK